ncbi:hypothetical protein C8R42DRAFT_779548 [Lentinula raphanica]|nr:hypothetical protein C8R42DRAFT_779548 [Lentinula raphanica]
MSKKTIFRKLPSKCAIDWFQPEKFNSLPPQIRKDYVDASVALPLLDQCNKLQVADWSLLLEIEFMEKRSLMQCKRIHRVKTSEDEDDDDGYNGDSDGDGDGEGDGMATVMVMVLVMATVTVKKVPFPSIQLVSLTWLTHSPSKRSSSTVSLMGRERFASMIPPCNTLLHLVVSAKQPQLVPSSSKPASPSSRQGTAGVYPSPLPECFTSVITPPHTPCPSAKQPQLVPSSSKPASQRMPSPSSRQGSTGVYPSLLPEHFASVPNQLSWGSVTLHHYSCSH